MEDHRSSRNQHLHGTRRKTQTSKRRGLSKGQHVSKPRRLNDVYKNYATKADWSNVTRKKEHWRTHCSSIDKNTTSLDLWTKRNQMLRRNMKAKPISVLTDKEERPVTEAKAKAEMFADHYEGFSSDKNLPETFLQQRRNFEEVTTEEEPRDIPGRVGGNEMNNPISLQDLKIVLKKPDTAVCDDRVSASMFRHDGFLSQNLATSVQRLMEPRQVALSLETLDHHSAFKAE